MERRFGPEVRAHISIMTAMRLRRRLLENERIGGAR